jgi:hypothetical protein
MDMESRRDENIGRVSSGAAMSLVSGLLVIAFIGCADSGSVRVPGSGRVTLDGKSVPSARV